MLYTLQHKRNNRPPTLRVGLQVPGELHREDGVEEGGDERSVKAAHGAKHFQQQQPQRHAELLNGDAKSIVNQGCAYTVAMTTEFSLVVLQHDY